MTEEQMDMLDNLYRAVAKKVYCSKCAYYYEDLGDSMSIRLIECTHPFNTVQFIREDYSKRKRDWRRVSTPAQINENNNCHWYEKRHFWNFYKRFW